MIKDTNYHSEWQMNRINFILSIYPPDFFNGKRILELGPCNGFIGSYFSNMGAVVHLIEGRIENVVNIKNDYPNVSVELGNLDTPEWIWGKWDIIINFGLFYHLEKFHKEHLNNCLNNCNLMFFETVVYDSNESKLFYRAENGFDQSLSQIGATPSRKFVEDIFYEKNCHFRIYNDSSLNGLASLGNDSFNNMYTHKYDWEETGMNVYNEFYRRFWIVNGK